MGLRYYLRKEAFFLVLIFYGLPTFWWEYNHMDDTFHHNVFEMELHFISARFLMSTGLLMICLSVSYISLPLDAMPDSIPTFGKVDDTISRMVCGAGFTMLAMGYKFGLGHVPPEFEFLVFVGKKSYHGVFIPVLTKIIIPLIGPTIRIITLPMKLTANGIIHTLLENAKESIANTEEVAGEIKGLPLWSLAA